MNYSMNEFIEHVNNECKSFNDKPITARMIRYLIAEKILSKPDGSTSSARYTEHHVKQVADYLKMKNSGLTVSQISNISKHSEGNMSSFELTEGMTLLVANKLYPERLDEEKAVKVLREIIKTIKGDIK